MTKSAGPSCRATAAAGLALVLLCTPRDPARAEAAKSEADARVVAVSYDDGRVTREARNATIDEIVRAISREAGFEADIAGSFDDPVVFAVTDAPLVPMLQRLVDRHSMVMILRPPHKASALGPIAKVTIRAAQRQSDIGAPSPREIGFARRVLDDSLPDYETTSPAERIAAIREIAEAKAEASIALLEQTVARDSDEGVRSYALHALGAIGGQEATLALGRIKFGDVDAYNRLMALEALVSMRSEVARSFVVSAADDPDDAVSAAADNALAGWR